MRSLENKEFSMPERSFPHDLVPEKEGRFVYLGLFNPVLASGSSKS